MFVIISSEHCCDKLSAWFWQGVLIDYDEVNSYWVYSLLTKRIKTYCDMKFYKYETTHNTDISNEFQYTEFDEYKESETVEIDISELTNQNTFTEFSIKSFTEVQNIDFYNISSELMNINIASCCSEHNQQPTCYQEDEFYYDSVHKIKTLQYIAFISTVTLSVNDDLKNLHEAITHEDWLLFQNVMNQKINSYWKHAIYEKVLQSSISAEALLFTDWWIYKIKHNQKDKLVKYKVCWVIYSYKQQESIDFYKIFASVIYTNL